MRSLGHRVNGRLARTISVLFISRYSGSNLVLSALPSRVYYEDRVFRKRGGTAEAAMVSGAAVWFGNRSIGRMDPDDWTNSRVFRCLGRYSIGNFMVEGGDCRRI